MKRFRIVSLLGLTALLLCVATPVQAASLTRGEDTVKVNERVETDAFLAGNSVFVDAPVAGELFAVGTNVNSSVEVERSAWMAGQNVTVSGAKHNAFLAGSIVTVSGTYGNDVYVAANEVVVKDDAVINGDLRIAGGKVTLGGTITGDVRLWVGMVTSSAKIGGSLISDGVGRITFTGGSVAKDLRYTSSEEAKGLDTVTIGGITNRTEPKSGTTAVVSALVLQVLSGLLFVVLFILVAPRRVRQTTQILRTRWPMAFLLGVAAFFLTPLIALLFFITVIGWPVGLLLIALYGAILLASYVYASFLLGSLVLEFLQNRRGHAMPESWNSREMWVAGLTGAFLFNILVVVPVIGWIIGFILFFVLIIPAFGALLVHEQHLS